MNLSSVNAIAWFVWAGLCASFVLGGALALAQARHWRQGRPAPTRWLHALRALPRRYLVDVHAVVARHQPTSWMHALLAGGFLASLLLWLLLLLPLLPAAAWVALQAVALGGCIAGLALLLRRRHGRPADAPQRLSRGAFAWLPAAFAVYLLASIAVLAVFAIPGASAARIGWAAAALLVLAMLGLAGLFVRGPLRHALAGALYIAVHPKPWRFHGEEAARTGSDTATMPALGATSARAFSWKQLLSFDACVECGRCQAVCPAHAAGHPLNPKALIQDLVRAANMRQGTYQGDGHGGAAPTPGEPAVLGITQSTLWSCTTCAACVNACPMFIEHVDAITELRCDMTQRQGAVPGKLPLMLRELHDSGNSFGAAPARRASWATDLHLPRLSEAGEAEVLLWLGDAAFELHGQQTLRAFVRALQAAGVDLAVLGEEEQDCGHLSRRCGDEAGFLRLREANLRMLARYRFRTLVSCDPHAFHTLRDEYPPLGARVMHHTELLAELLQAGRLAPRAAHGAKVVFHDACYLGRHSNVYDAPRLLLERAGCERVEAPRARENSFCCGAGGGQAWAGTPSRTSIPLLRYEELAATGATEIAVACPNCKNMLQSAAGPAMRVRDVAEILEASL